MKRTFLRFRPLPLIENGTVASVLVGLCLISTLVFAAPLPGTPLPAPKGKEKYSSRPKNYVPPTMIGPTVFEGTVPTAETVVVEGPIAATPIPAPIPPRERMTGTRQRLEFTPQVLETSAPAGQARSTKETKTEPIVITEHSEKRPISSVEFGPSATKPKGMAIPLAPPAARQPTETAKKESGDSVLNFTPKKTADTPEKATVAKPVIEPKASDPVVKEPVNDLDDFNARLAKIQLEKHQLDETLALIEKIKSPNHKVKTLVDLAEYVSRDVNYKREADALYTLAVDGIEALADGKPVLVKMPAASAKPQPKPAAPTYQPPRRTAPTLIEEKEPEPKPAPTPPVNPFVEPKSTPVNPFAEPDAPKTPAPATSRTPVLLDEEPKAPAEKVEKKEPVTAPTPTLAPPRLEPPIEPKPAATPSVKPAAEPTKRPSILLMEEPKTEEPKATAPKTEEKKPEPAAAPTAEPEKKEKTPAATPPKSTKRPMPGKRGVPLETN